MYILVFADNIVTALLKAEYQNILFVDTTYTNQNGLLVMRNSFLPPWCNLWINSDTGLAASRYFSAKPIKERQGSFRMAQLDIWIPLFSYTGLIERSTAVATTSCCSFKGKLKVSCSYSSRGWNLSKNFLGSFGPFMSKFSGPSPHNIKGPRFPILADGTQKGITVTSKSAIPVGPQSFNVEGPHAILRIIASRARLISIPVLKQLVQESTVAAEYPQHTVTAVSTCSSQRRAALCDIYFLDR